MRVGLMFMKYSPTTQEKFSIIFALNFWGRLPGYLRAI
jgi:hypothetical protein